MEKNSCQIKTGGYSMHHIHEMKIENHVNWKWKMGPQVQIGKYYDYGN